MIRYQKIFESKEPKQAAGILIRCGDEYLLGQRANYMKSYPGTWSVFGGAIEKNEDPKQTAIREVREETKYKGKLKNIKLLMEQEEPVTKIKFYTYLADVDEKFVPKLNGEHQRARWFKLADFPVKIHPEIHDLIKHKRQELQEAKQVGILYHFTTYDAANSILYDEEIKTSGDVVGGGKISLTRNYKLGQQYKFGPVRFVIDGNKLSNHFKIEPYLYRNDEYFRNVAGEYEEVVYRNISMDYVLDVQALDSARGRLILKDWVDNIDWVEAWQPFKKSISAPSTLVKEFTLPQFKNHLGNPTKKSYAQRKQIKGVNERGTQFIDFDLVKGIAIFGVEPTHERNTKVVDLAGRFHADNLYTVKVEFVDWKDWLDDWRKITLDQWKQLLRSADVKWSCDCGAFLYQGVRYVLTQVDSAIDPLNIPDPHWRPIMGDENTPFICKHCNVVIEKAMRYPQQMYNEILRKIKQKAGPELEDEAEEETPKEIPKPKVGQQLKLFPSADETKEEEE